jgi:2-oxoglutarate dehydrogenase complex dehydrogenase (E1) component-like enzyme
MAARNPVTKPVGFSQQFLGRESEQSRVSDSDTLGTSTGASVEFGANEWLVDELWGLYQQDPELVEKSWWPLFESRAAQSGLAIPPVPARSNVSRPVSGFRKTNRTNAQSEESLIEKPTIRLPDISSRRTTSSN